jgi:hypothetical protein
VSTDEVRFLETELDKANQRINRIHEVHFTDQLPVGIIICHHCRTPWPCNTIEALDDEDQ